VSFHVELDPAALRDYERLPSPDQALVRDVIGRLVVTGMPDTSEAVKDVDGGWRIPVGTELVLLVLVSEGDLYISGIIPRLWLL
jgi:hypothetical protein